MREIQELLRDNGPTAVAGLLGLSQARISQLTTGKSAPGMTTARAVARFKGIDVFALLSGAAA
jgi:hypothetical protein